jgi:membrane protein implicated in regulation of membrane protease activity
MSVAILYWHWFVAAVVLVILESLLPGFFFLWLGIAAGVTGLVLLAAPGLSWQVQVLMFAALSVISIVAWRAWQRRHPDVSDQPTLNRRAEQYVGRTFTLAEPIQGRRGKVRIDDTTWRVEGDDLPAGAAVKVIAAEGVVLKVERA